MEYKYTLNDLEFVMFNLGQVVNNSNDLIEKENELFTGQEINEVMKQIYQSSPNKLYFESQEVFNVYQQEKHNVLVALDFIKNTKISSFEDIVVLYKILVNNTPYQDEELWNNHPDYLNNITINNLQANMLYLFKVWDDENKKQFQKDFKKNLKSLQGISNLYTSIVALQPFSNCNKRIANFIAFSYFYHHKKQLHLDHNINIQIFNDFIIPNYGLKAPKYLDIYNNIPLIDFSTTTLTNHHKNKISSSIIKHLKYKML